MREEIPDLVTLQIIQAIGETGTFKKAAATVDMSQQAASSRIRAAEEALGFSLVDRTRKGSTLSSRGQLIAEWSAGYLAAMHQFALSVKTLRPEAANMLTVAASQTISEQFIPQWMAAFRHRTGGDASLRLTSGNSAFVIDQIREGHSAVGLIETPDIPADLASATIRIDELVIVVAPSHPWARRARPLTPEELASEALVTREAGSGTRRTLEAAIGTARPEIALSEPAAILATTSAIRAAVASGLGPAVLSATTVQDDIMRGILRRVPIEGLTLHRPFTALWRSGTPLPPAAEVFFAILRD
ncbi:MULTISPECIES: LysR family transcriptional regulator [unclassified Frondihabitans]|uniref:LysR family transcriptional regulator n=1 Tax=unclassified Frondihabitans TaxID=2626248 RepID=UPI000F4E5A08|nr:MULTISPECIES: LysR family transcriptional regulator [unclassified Frondihabitans]RPE73766.1 DNA-binding transcriptional LysR family regulator [Frondihabitans sp. PhB153]RPF02096.1 DNA-binding transcriptional LysR family regulator [Frondihabitans sp. PhB161]